MSSDLTPNLVEIYALCDPDTGAIRYIGKANDSKKRLASHIRDSRRRNTPVYCWIRKLVYEGKSPKLEVLECVTKTEWENAERRLIAECKVSGRLLNLAEGGDQPHCPTEVCRRNARFLRLDAMLPGSRVINILVATLKTWHGGNKHRTAKQINDSRARRHAALSDLRTAIDKYGIEQTAASLIQKQPWLARYA